MTRKKGQTSVETIALLAVLLIVFVVILVIGTSMTTTSSFQTQQLIAQRAVDDIVAVSEEVFLQGNGTKVQLFVTFPQNINRTYINGNFFEIHTYERGGNIQKLVGVSEFTLQGSLPNSSGTYRVSVMSNGTFVYLTT